MKVLIIGSNHRWRMEKCTERALRRDKHKTLLIDDKRAARVLGRKLTQRWALAKAKSFKPDFVFLGKCHGLDVETVATILQGTPNSMWYHDPQWYKSTFRPDIAHIVAVARLTMYSFTAGLTRTLLSASRIVSTSRPSRTGCTVSIGCDCSWRARIAASSLGLG